MIDFSSFSNNLEGSSLTNAIIIALLSFILSSLIGITYEKTSQEIERPRFFIQSLILISVPVATVMQAIGDSLAHGLGLLGALAVIRFRNTLKNPRNIVFMFSSIAVGVAMGVYGINIAIIGTIMFCLIVLILHFSHLSKSNQIIGFLQFEMPNEDGHLASTPTTDEITAVINNYCQRALLMTYVIKNVKGKKKTKGISVFEYKIRVSDKPTATILVNDMTQKFKLMNVKLTFNRDDYEKI